MRLMCLPGFVGAFLGAVALSSLSAEKAEPFMAGFLFLLGVYSAFLLARAVVTLRRDGQSAAATA